MTLTSVIPLRISCLRQRRSSTDPEQKNKFCLKSTLLPQVGRFSSSVYKHIQLKLREHNIKSTAADLPQYTKTLSLGHHNFSSLTQLSFKREKKIRLRNCLFIITLQQIVFLFMNNTDYKNETLLFNIFGTIIKIVHRCSIKM